jgi:hypothetical protein
MEVIESIKSSERQFLTFIEEAKRLADIQNLKDFQLPDTRLKLKELAFVCFRDLIENALKEVSDPDKACCCIDLPSSGYSASEDALWSAVAAMAINSVLTVPVLDAITSTPFTLIQASKEEQEKLARAGLEYFSPEQKLGFHSDGAFKGGILYIPEFVSTYNLFLGYANPGFFYWLPLTRWTDMWKYKRRIGSGDYKFQITPITYSNVGREIEIVRNETIEAPIFLDSIEGTSVFLNGKVLESENCNIKNVLEMKQSLRQVKSRIAIEQKTKRLIVVKNTQGLHARDIFEVPLFEGGITRSMLRSVHNTGVKVKGYA